MMIIMTILITAAMFSFTRRHIVACGWRIRSPCGSFTRRAGRKSRTMDSAVPIGHTRFSWGGPQRISKKKGKRRRLRPSFENVKFRAELSRIKKSHDKEILAKEREIVRLRKVVKSQTGRISSLRSFMDSERQKFRQEIAKLEVAKKISTHKYAQQTLKNLRSKIKNLSMNTQGKLAKSELEYILCNATKSVCSQEHVEEVRLPDYEQDWKIRSLLNAFKRCTPVRLGKRLPTPRDDLDLDLYMKIDDYLKAFKVQKENTRRKKKKAPKTCTDKKVLTQRVRNSNEFQIDSPVTVPRKPPQNRLKNYELQNSIYNDSSKISIRLLQAELNDDNTERDLYAEIEALRKENLRLKEELIHREEQFNHAFRGRYASELGRS